MKIDQQSASCHWEPTQVKTYVYYCNQNLIWERIILVSGRHPLSYMEHTCFQKSTPVPPISGCLVSGQTSKSHDKDSFDPSPTSLYDFPALSYFGWDSVHCLVQPQGSCFCSFSCVSILITGLNNSRLFENSLNS